MTGEQCTILELESSWWKYAGGKDAVVRERFGWSMTRYYIELNRLIDDPAALAHDPVTVRRLRRLREQRRRPRCRAS